MKKLNVLLKGPILTQSGYGQHARMLFDALFEDPSFEVFCENINWGICSFLTHETDQFRKINACVHKRELLRQQNPNHQFDIFVHVTIPQEFEHPAKYNIGVTAGAETDRISAQWVQKCNEMDLIIVPSEHTKNGIEKTAVDWMNQKTGEKGTLKVQKPVVVCPEGVDTNIFKPTTDSYENLLDIDFSSDFNFLHVGMWGRGGFGEDRKNISNLVRYFIETFKGKKNVGLVLKTSMGKNSEADKEVCVNRLREIKSLFPQEEIPPIYLVHGNLTEQEMASLYNHPKIKAFVSFTAGEGFGIPLLEAAMCELPIIATNWSGHLDFLKGKFSKVKYDLREIPQAAVWDPILIKDSKWAVADAEDARHRMSLITTKYGQPKQWAKELREQIKDSFSLENIKQIFVDTVKRCALGSESANLNPVEFLQSYIDSDDDYNVLFTMPRSNGDVYLATAILDGLKRQLPQKSKIYFATSPQFFPILEDNPHIHKVIPWQQFMMVTEIAESVFDLFLSPDTATQYQFSNWIGRTERHLIEEYANHCDCEIGDYFIKTKDDFLGVLPKDYVTINVGYKQGHARYYADWQEVVNNLIDCYEGMNVVQIGSTDEPLLKGVIDLRGKTDVHELATVVKNSQLHIGIDSFCAHLAGGFETPSVSIFGSSYSHKTGPFYKNRDAKYILLETENRMGCNRACFKDVCKVNKDMPCSNSIDPKSIFHSCTQLLEG